MHPSQRTTGRQDEPSALARWKWLSLLLLAEGLVLLSSFSTTPLHESQHEALRLLSNVYTVPRFAIAAITAALLFGRGRLQPEIARFRADLDARSRTWAPLLFHLLAFAGLFALTAHVFGGSLESSDAAWPWVLAWCVWTCITGITWLLAWVPARALIVLVMRCSGPIVAVIALAAVAWYAGIFTLEVLGAPLQRSTLWLSQAVLGWFVPHVVLDPTHFVFGTERFTVRIESHCSGFEGIGLIWVFLASYLWIFRARLRFPGAFLLLAIGTLAVWFANALRLVALVVIGSFISPDLAVEGFHSVAGLLAVCGVALGTVAVARRMRFFMLADVEQAAGEESNATAAYLAPLLAVVAIRMITGAFAGALDLLYPVSVLGAVAVLLAYRRVYAPAGARVRGSTPILRAWSWPAASLGVLAFVPWLAFTDDPVADRTLKEAWSSLPALAGWLWLVSRVLGSIVIAPLTEELAFRGYLTRRLVAANFESVPVGYFSVASLGVSSLLFGAMHPHWIVATWCGIVYAVALYRRGKLTDAILAHAVTNALATVFTLGSGKWSLW